MAARAVKRLTVDLLVSMYDGLDALCKEDGKEYTKRSVIEALIENELLENDYMMCDRCDQWVPRDSLEIDPDSGTGRICEKCLRGK